FYHKRAPDETVCGSNQFHRFYQIPFGVDSEPDSIKYQNKSRQQNHDSQPSADCSYAAEALLHHLQQLLIEAHFVNAIILLDLGNEAVNTSYIRVGNQLQPKRSGQKIQLSH